MDRRIYWALGTTFTYLAFFKWIPVTTYAKAPVIFSFFGAFVFGFFLYQLLTDTFGRRGKKDEKSKGIVMFSLIAAPLVSIGIAMMLYFNFHLRQKDLLVDQGIIIEGTVLEKDSYILKGEKYYRLKVEFKDKDGKMHTSREDVERKEYNLVKDYGKLKIIYLESNPDIHDYVIMPTSFRQYQKAMKK